MATDTPQALLEVENVAKSFGGLQAVRNCSLHVRQGTITGLIGPNGAGKTTLFNLISGFYAPDSGSIIFQGKRIDGLPPHRIFRHGLCRTFQVPKELKLMTVLENLMLVPRGPGRRKTGSGVGDALARAPARAGGIRQGAGRAGVRQPGASAR